MNPLEISPSQFRRLVEQVTEVAAGYLEDMDSAPISPTTTGMETERVFHTPLPETGMGEEALRSLTDVIHFSRVQNGRFFGYVLGSGEPVAAVADLLASVINQNVTAWRSGPAAVQLERVVVGWIAQAIGCNDFRGHLTGGGSSANLMGLAMAREANAPANETGFKGQGIVYASDEVHMSIPKSVALLGIGRDHLRLVATDDSFRIIPEELDRMIRHDRAAGKTPIAVVATAGTVSTGAVDPLRAIEQIAHECGAWLHVDGAYGALAAMADRKKFDGLELADSVSLDPHKWLYQPLDCGCLLYRALEPARKAFSHTGDYARSLKSDPIEGFAFFEESIELSRRFRALKLWLSLRYHGFAAFRESIQNDLQQARRLVEAVKREPALELVAQGDLSAVCFRHVGNGGLSAQDLNGRNLAILTRVIQRGRVYLSNASLRGKFCMRACIVNHRTKDADVDSVITEVLAAGREIGS